MISRVAGSGGKHRPVVLLLKYTVVISSHQLEIVDLELLCVAFVLIKFSYNVFRYTRGSAVE